MLFASLFKILAFSLDQGVVSVRQFVVLFMMTLLFFILFLILLIMNISKSRIVRNQILSGRKILVAEDDVISQRIWTSLLKENQMTITLASNGMEAVNYAKGHSFDLILMDIEMPVLNGIDATRKIRERMEQDKVYVPILALTAHSGQGDKAEILFDAGFDDILTKPINPKLLRSKLIYWLSHSKKNVSSGFDRSYKTGLFSSVTQNTINIKKGLGYTDNNEDLYINLLKRFVMNYDSLRIDGQTPFNIEIKTQLHNLKGIAGSLGADSLRKATVALELSFKRKVWDRHNLEIFIKKYADTISDGDEILAEYWGKKGKVLASPVLPLNDEIGTEKLKLTLTYLREALSQCDPMICRSIIKDLEAMNPPRYAVHMLDSIFQKVTEYQYEAADSKVEKLIGHIEMEG